MKKNKSLERLYLSDKSPDRFDDALISFIRNRIRDDEYTTLKFFEVLESNTTLGSLNISGKTYFQYINFFHSSMARQQNWGQECCFLEESFEDQQDTQGTRFKRQSIPNTHSL